MLALGLVVLAACSQPAPAPEAEAPAADPATVAPAPAEPAPPAPAPDTAAPDAAKNDPAVINFEGFGPAKFGADEEQVRMSWGRPLEAGTPAEGATCYQLFMDPRPEGARGIVFLFEEGKFARYDVDVPLHVAPGDIAVGATAMDVMAAFPGAVEEQPHKYVQGARNLVVTPADGSAARLVFEVNPEGIVSAWHIGVPPQVHYVEGCG
jgi:hypothetical protein